MKSENRIDPYAALIGVGVLAGTILSMFAYGEIFDLLELKTQFPELADGTADLVQAIAIEDPEKREAFLSAMAEHKKNLEDLSFYQNAVVMVGISSFILFLTLLLTSRNLRR